MNGIHYLLSVVSKEFQLILKDRAMLAVLFLLPLLLGTMVAGPNLLFSQQSEGGEAAVLLDVCLVNQDAGIFGQEVAKAIQSVEELNIQSFDTVAEAEQQVATGDATAAIVIPADFTAQIDAYTPTAIEVIVDPAEPEGASIVTGIMGQVIDEVAIWGEVQYGVRALLEGSGVLAGAAPEEQRAVGAQTLGVIMTALNEMRKSPVIAVSSEDLTGAEEQGSWVFAYFAYVFPAFAVMFIFFIVGMAASSLLRERETGVLRRLAASPMPRGIVIAGKMIAYGVIPCLQTALLFTLANTVFDMPLGQSPAGLVAVTLATALVATALGMLVAALAKTSKQAESLGYVLGFVLAGLGGAIAMGPGTMFFKQEGLMGILSQLTPHGHAVKAFYHLMAESGTLVQVLPQVGVLLAMAVVLFLIARWRFRFDQ